MLSEKEKLLLSKFSPKRTRRGSQDEKIDDNLARAMENILDIKMKENSENNNDVERKEAEITAKTWAEVTGSASTSQQNQSKYYEVAEKGRIAAKAAIKAERAMEEVKKLQLQADEAMKIAEEYNKEANERKLEARMAFEETCNIS